jgi:UDP:flavonoid glycosyltransferase YjiC (YdhE family)
MLFPVVGLARRLRASGHGVGFVTGSWARPMIEAQGLTWLAGGPEFRTRRWHDPGSALRQSHAVCAAAAAWQPDVLLTSALALGPLLAAEHLARPVAVAGLLAPLWETGRQDWDPQVGELEQAYRRARTAAGLRGAGPPAPLLGDAWLRPGPRGRLPPGPDRRVHDVGALLWSPPPPAALLDWLPEAGAIYLQPAPRFGGPGFWRCAVQALAAQPAAAATARMDGPPGALPAAWHVAPHVSIEAVLPRAACIVASGTSTVAQAALRHGVPAVLLPGGSEHHEAARLLRSEAAAAVLDVATLTPGRLADAVQAATGRRSEAQAAARRWNAGEAVDPLSVITGLA